jgi:hypothetical protein
MDKYGQSMDKYGQSMDKYGQSMDKVWTKYGQSMDIGKNLKIVRITLLLLVEDCWEMWFGVKYNPQYTFTTRPTVPNNR